MGVKAEGWSRGWEEGGSEGRRVGFVPFGRGLRGGGWNVFNPEGIFVGHHNPVWSQDFMDACAEILQPLTTAIASTQLLIGEAAVPHVA